MDILNGKPVKAFIYQDHEAHIQAHMSAMQNPKIMALIGQNPMAGGIQAAMMAHINEHIAFQYRREIEEQLGVQLPEPNAELPEDVEVMLSKLVAEASGRLLAKDQTEAQQQQIQQQMQDPVVQAQMQDAQNKAAEVQRKVAKDQTDAALKASQQEIERERIASQERIAGVNAGIKAASDRDKNNMTADKNRTDAKLAGFKVGQEIARNLNGSV
jgi:hypothetical protein